MNDKQLAVIGMGTFGKEIALSLMNSNFNVCAIDLDAEIIESMKEQVTSAMVLDTTQEKAILEAEINEMDTVVVAIGAENLENSILTTALLKQLGVQHIIARATSELHERILHQVGADVVVNPEREMGKRLARQIARPGFLEMIALPGGICIAQLPLPESFIEKTLEEIGVRKRFGINVLGIQRLTKEAALLKQKEEKKTPEQEDKQDHIAMEQMLGLPMPGADMRLIVNISPSQDRFKAGDILVVMGRETDINHLLLA